MSIFFLLPLRQDFVKLFEIALVDHLPDGYQKLLKFLKIKQLVIIAIKQTKITLVFDLLLKRKVFLFYAFLFVVQTLQQIHLTLGRLFG
jgi:hypothetical protein